MQRRTPRLLVWLRALNELFFLKISCRSAPPRDGDEAQRMKLKARHATINASISNISPHSVLCWQTGDPSMKTDQDPTEYTHTNTEKHTREHERVNESEKKWESETKRYTNTPFDSAQTCWPRPERASPLDSPRRLSKCF